ncbi:flavin reductase family protein [Nocardia sp. NPDC051030]|uniref:flavin reductase family protein n=1 Tax=Nocardia sp. NPDC051030 TaxID=3155162 RepID=UPI00344137E7
MSRDVDDGADVPSDPSLDRFVGLLDYPMYVVTTYSDGRFAGCLVGFASQTSIDPPLFLVCLSVQNHTYSVAAQARHLAVHLIARENVALTKLFGEETGNEIDKFEWCTWHRGAHGMPILDEAVAWFVGTIIERFDVGDHRAFLLSPTAVKAVATNVPHVTYADVRTLDPGNEP